MSHKKVWVRYITVAVIWWNGQIYILVYDIDTTPSQGETTSMSGNDVNAVASRWGGVDGEPTCLAANSLGPTRRDYFVVNDIMHPLVAGVSLHSHDMYPTHTPLRLTIRISASLGSINKQVRPPSIANAIADCLDSVER